MTAATPAQSRPWEEYLETVTWISGWRRNRKQNNRLTAGCAFHEAVPGGQAVTLRPCRVFNLLTWACL